MKAVKFIWVGKLKRPFFQDACDFYMNRLSKFFKIVEVCLKDAPTHLEATVKTEKEGEAILGKLTVSDRPILLDERGRLNTSRELAANVRTWIEHPNLTPCFIIGGPYGLAKSVRERSNYDLSLGPLTLPHELARVTLLEQLYRAATILNGLPYHHD